MAFNPVSDDPRFDHSLRDESLSEQLTKTLRIAAENWGYDQEEFTSSMEEAFIAGARWGMDSGS